MKQTPAWCPICGWEGSCFLPKHGRDKVLCPNCESFERHRHQYLVFMNLSLAASIADCKVLHIAPKSCIRRILERASCYVSLDLEPGKAIVAADLCNMPFEDASFDLVWCSHVLEHIREVDKAISEIYRVLRCGGTAILDVPIERHTTQSLSRPSLHRHYWAAGKDWFERYSCFDVVTMHTSEAMSSRVGILTSSVIAVCRK